jgi:aminoglycoside phosphotransferase (APT) family kinase protein
MTEPAGAPNVADADRDREMSTIGDPLADLGYLPSFWRESR